MAAPIFQAWATTYLATLTNGTVPAPASVAQGDLLLLVVEDQGTDATTTPPAVTGGTETWTLIPASPQFSPGATRLNVWWARASQATPTMPNVAIGVNHVFARVCRITGVKSSGNPWNGTEYAGSSNNAANGTVPGFTVAGADRLCIFIAGTGANTTANNRFSAWAENTTTVLSSITEIHDQTDTIGGGGGFGAASALISSGGTTNGVDFTEIGVGHGMISVALSPDAAGTTVTVDTPGAVVATGKTAATNLALAVTAGALALAGSTTIVLQVGTTITVDTPGAVTATGGTAATNLQVGVIPGAISAAGQSVATNLTLGVIPGAVAVSGATDITLQSATRVEVTTPGQVGLTGSSVATNQTQAVTAGAISITGSTGITLTTSGGGTTLTVDTPGQIAAAGQQVPLRFTQTITPGALQVSGATDVTLQVGARVTVDVPGSLVAAGQQVALNLLLALQPGSISFTGGTVTLTDSGANFGEPVLDALAVLGDVTGAAHTHNTEGRAVLREVP